MTNQNKIKAAAVGAACGAACGLAGIIFFVGLANTISFILREAGKALGCG